MIDTRRHLPHWVPDEVAVFVTWRLAGSLPRARAPMLYREPPGRKFVGEDRVLDKAALGPVWLKDARIARMVVNALHYGESQRKLYVLRAFVVMANHVHVVWEPKAEMSVILRWLKGTIAGRAKRILGLPGGPFWQEESYDHWVRSGDELRSIVRYVEWNPVKAGLVRLPEEWPWSSARGRQTARPSVLPLANQHAGNTGEIGE